MFLFSIEFTKMTPRVNFTNVFRVRFLYERLFSNLNVTRKRRWYEKRVQKTLVKLTPNALCSVLSLDFRKNKYCFIFMIFFFWRQDVWGRKLCVQRLTRFPPSIRFSQHLTWKGGKFVLQIIIVYTFKLIFLNLRNFNEKAIYSIPYITFTCIFWIWFR